MVTDRQARAIAAAHVSRFTRRAELGLPDETSPLAPFYLVGIILEQVGDLFTQFGMAMSQTGRALEQTLPRRSP